MTLNKHILTGFILLVAIISLGYGESMAVVPYPIAAEESLKTRTKEEHLLEIIKKIETHEEVDMKFYRGLKDELKQILEKEGIGNEG